MSKKNFGYVLTLVILLSFIFAGLYENQIPEKFYSFREIPLPAALSYLLGPVSALYLFIWMASHAINNHSLKNKAGWVFAFVFLNWLASIFYFFSVYRKQPNANT